MTPARHVLQTTVGLSIEMVFDEQRGPIELRWSPRPPNSEDEQDAVFREYAPWRNEIMCAWTLRHHCRYAIVDRDSAGGERSTYFDNGMIVGEERKL